MIPGGMQKKAGYHKFLWELNMFFTELVIK